MKVLSLYCGAGGIDQGLKQAGIKTTLAVDMVQDCIDTIRLNHDCETICDAVENVESSLGRYDVVVGGPPCQDFSVANNNRTLDPTEIDRFWRITEKTKAKYWLMENVPNIIKVCSRKNHLINCADYGTPQKRLRRFFTNLPLPKATHAEKPNHTLSGSALKKWVSVSDALGLAAGSIEDRKIIREAETRKYPTDAPSHTIHTDARNWYHYVGGFEGQNRKEITKSMDKPCDTLTTRHNVFLTSERVYSKKYLQNKSPAQYHKHKPAHIDGPIKTILSKDRGPQVGNTICDDATVRKLTLEECAILQGFPKSYKFAGNKTSIMRQIGNAVPSQPIEAFFRSVFP